MATKINQSVYGTVPTTQYSKAVCPKTILNLYNDGNFDPSGNCEGGFEKSISPWGIGGGMCGDWFTINAQRSANGRYARLRMDTAENFNKPISFWNKSVGSSSYDNKNSTRFRIAGNCKLSNNTIVSNGYTENTLTLQGINANNSPYGKLEYNNACAHSISVAITRNETASNNKLIPLGNYTVEQLDSFGADWFEDSFEMSAFKWGLSMYNSASNVPNQFYGIDLATVTTKSLEVGEMYKALALEDNNVPDTFYDNAIISAQNVCGAWDYGHRAYVDNDDIKLISNKFTNTTHYNYTKYGAGKVYGVGNGNKHVFEDISYHYEIRFFVELNGTYVEVFENELILSSQQLYILPYFKIDETTYNTKWESIKAIIRHELAFIGFPFAISESQRGFIGENNVSVPVFDEHMITTGNYLTGAAAQQLPNAQWGDIFDDTMPEYDPDYNPPAPGPGPGGGETPWDDNPITRIQEGYWTGFGGTTYISSMNSFSSALDSVKNRLDQNSNKFWDEAKDAADVYADDLLNEDKRKKFLKTFEDLINNNSINNAVVSNSPNTNYTDCFLSCIRYPFDITNYFNIESNEAYILWGRYKIISATNTWKVNGYQSGQIVQGGTLYVEKKYDNFLNYAPYTTAELYIPYCGSVPIDLEVFAGHTIDVKYLIDWFSGACLALIYRDSVVVDQIPGQIGTSVGIVAEDIQSYQNAMFNGSQTLKAQKNAFKNSFVNGMGQSMDQLSGAIGNVATTVLGGEPSSSNSQSGGGAFAKGFNVGTGIGQNYQNVKTAKYNLDHTYIDFKQIGSNGPSVGSWNEQVCRLVLYYPTFLPGYNPSEYGHTVGFACLFNKTLSEFSGLTVCSSVDTSGLTDATESEKTLIEDALKSGVYL